MRWVLGRVVMKFKKKPYKSRKIFCRKSGGGGFRFSGKQSNWGNQSINSKAEESIAQIGLVASMLQKIGFRIGAR